MAEVYNKLLQDAQNKLEISKQSISQHDYFKQFSQLPIIEYLYKDCNQISKDINKVNLCRFFKACNNYKKAEYRYKNKFMISIDYNDRRSGVIAYSAVCFILGLLRGRGIRAGLKNYLISSLIFCRENYKFTAYQIDI